MKDTIIRNYVNSDKTNLNYVRLVLVARRSPEFPLHPLTIKDARKNRYRIRLFSNWEAYI